MNGLLLAITPGMWFSLLAAGTRRAEQIRRRFPEEEPNVTPEQLVLALIAILSLTVVMWLVNNWLTARRERPYHSPRRLFHELARVHGLGFADRRLLREIAAWHELPYPALLFIEPHRFQSPEMINAIGKEKEIARLVTTLFDEPPPSTPA